VAFIRAVFDRKDYVLVRPVETWTEGNKKKSSTVWKCTQHVQADFLTTRGKWVWLQGVAERTKANLFFGICPRLGTKFDLAWQIRTVRVLWADLDNCVPEEAKKRCADAAVPTPSIVVKSGHGVHLYWILETPYLIDDVGDPLPVITEFIDQGEGEKKLPVKFAQLPDRRRIYEFLGDPTKKSRMRNPEWPSLSAKAIYIQDVIAGISSKIGGDHTQDLARLLRFPCTWNRKNERNGVPPVLCEVVGLDTTRRYPLTEFEPFAGNSPARTRREAVAKMRLPAVRKLTMKRSDRLDKLINECAAADPGTRSERDWNLICWAVENGVDTDDLWRQVEGVGKFAERGRAYFDRTLTNARSHTQEKIYSRVERKHAARSGRRPNGFAATNGHAAHKSSNGAAGDKTEGGQPPPVEPPPGEDSNAAAREPDGPYVPESLTDPHRLARCWQLMHATTETTGCGVTRGNRVAFYRQNFWFWERTHWRLVPDHEMEAKLNRFAKRDLDEAIRARLEQGDGDDDEAITVPPVTRQLVSNMMGALAGDVLVRDDVLQPSWRGTDPGPRNWISFRNGLLDVDAYLAGAQEVLRPHAPLWFSPTSLPYAFDPEADCPQWRSFLGRNLGDDPGKPRLLQQWAGYLLLHDLTLQRFLLMIGEGANGKSVVCAVLAALLGEDNVSTVPLELFADKFRLVGTLGKLANIASEVGEFDKVAEGQLKAFVSGDAIEFERKFKSPFTARPTARLVLATNNPPAFSDKSDGVWRRVMPLPFSIQIPPAEQKPGLDKPAFWQASGELPGILNWALVGLHDLRQAGRFVLPKTSKDMLEKLRTDSNPARRFLQDTFAEGEDAFLTAGVYGEYTEWCKQHGHHALAEGGFGKEVARVFKRIKRGKAPLDPATNRRLNTYVGLRRKTANDDDTDSNRDVSL
jgi:P4 family phage/plasmid primase-like protien